MKRTGVIGSPVMHSLSPLIHNHWIARYGIDARYDAIEINPDMLAGRVNELADNGYCGFNVTIPHKVDIMPLCDTVEETARVMGAVNTVVIRDGKLHGRNTDAFGFMENLRAQKPGYVPGKTVVLGAGGAARAVIYGLLESGTPEIILCNRSGDRADALSKEPFCKSRVGAADWDHIEDTLGNASLLVNTTSLGMTGQPDLAINLGRAPLDCIVCDIVYRPLITPLLAQAAARGMPYVTGLGMLLHQARPAFQAWFDVMPDITHDLEVEIEQALRK